MKKESRAIGCWTALILAALAWIPSLTNFMPAVLVCLITLPVGLAHLKAAPRLAVATVYWSVAALAQMPLMLLGAPDELIVATLLGGLALSVMLPLDYARKRKPPLLGEGNGNSRWL